MAALISALDSATNIQYGENNHIEYQWSEISQEKILQLSFQLVRVGDKMKREFLAKKYKECFENGTYEERKILIKLLAHTRDIETGKGEYALTFSILKEMMSYKEKLCIDLMIKFVGFEEEKEKPMGSWKDMKYFFNELDNAPVKLIKIMNSQLKKDIEKMNRNESMSLLAKWIPREKSKKFGWINEKLAKDYFEHYGESKKGWNKSAIDKAKTHYRKIISSLNKYIDTVQIKQCGQNWENINFNNVTSITMMKQKKAFLDEKNDSDDRKICRLNLLKYLEEVKEGKKEMKGKRTSMTDFIKSALNIESDEERFIINEAWKNNSKDTKSLENMIAMVDTSGSMECDNNQPLYSAIGLGIRVAEKSKLGKRIMTFHNKPSWINLENSVDFVDEVEKVRCAGWGFNTNFHEAMNIILDQITKNKIPAEEIENLVLTVFSDMQFDKSEPHNTNEYNNTVRQILEKKFNDAGVKVCGKGYKLPHILFWNLRSTDGFPELSYQTNVTMLSGYSPMLLNTFIEEGINGIRDITPWKMLLNMLNTDRYNQLEKILD